MSTLPRHQLEAPSAGHTRSGVVPGAAAVTSVAIVNFNAREYLGACLDSVMVEARGEVVVVDNASSDGSPEMVRARYPAVALRANTANVGYGAAANQAVQHCQGDYVLLLNADTTLTPGAMVALSAYMHRHPRAAVVGPLLRYPDGVPQRSYFAVPGTLGWFLENEPAVWAIRWLPLWRDRFLCFTPPIADRVVPWVHGAALLLRRTAFEAVGGFDESYFMYFEEVDLCLRLRALGYEIHFTPSAAVVHVGGVSTSQCRTAMLIAHFRSTERFYRRHYSVPRVRFWVALMRLKITACLARDMVHRRTESNDAVRRLLTEKIEAWKAILRRCDLYSTDPG
jgi:GT2 family glycosyltransferase